MFGEIGTVRNEADESSLQILSLFRESISEVRLKEPESVSAYFSQDYSHYIVVHTPLNFRFPEKREAWNLRFCQGVGVSVVELVVAETGSAYVRGLMAVNGSKIFAILPFTSIDADKAKNAKFPEDRMAQVRAQVLPSVFPGIKGETILDIGSGFGTLTMELAKNNPESQVYGIDIHDSLTGQSQMNAEVLGIPNVQFKTGSAYALPFEGDSVDAATCFFMLHHLDDIKFALFEIKRVLKKGGLLTAVEPLAHQHHHGPQLSETAWIELFEDVGFNAESETPEGAIVLKAVKRG
ncbi:TPA: class I SAM-dependent methyltransferase [Methanosarcina acetivorans]|uniref:UbiE/COQ5 methyltransferase n=2 Tax=Methanosarcina acetivorans TaxID=2214 RepID=Q8TJ73_METAC|nr:class I SAM-dependent methyltransferase [Methanosarcina acetivorans]AAM07266.1 ubiE/COQ5 methyltransferase [Methanosarcina acetivorans C2A]HIH94376.1 class I SAM-dependent methyltransferase [Methanosarcina acetivorans]